MASTLKTTDIRHVIRQHNPWQQRALIVIGTMLVLAGGYGLYAIGRSQAEYDWAKASRMEGEQRRLTAEIRRLRNENERLSQRVVLLERTGDIDKRAAGLLNQSLRDEQAQLSALKEQVAFYRGIVSPEESAAGVRIYEMRMQPAAEPGIYQYDLILIQAMPHGDMISGGADFSVEGALGGQSRAFRRADIEIEKGRDLAFSFKHFQELSGSVRLPAGFTPARVKVEVTRAGASARIQQQYNWQDIARPAGAK
jgi:hypothetical protein